MPYTTFKVRQIFKDNSLLVINGNQVNANRNNIAILDFPNDNGNPADNITYYVNGSNLTDQIIQDQAFFIIKTLNDQETSLAAITINKITIPIAPAINPLITAQTDFNKKLRAAQVSQINDPALTASLANLVALE